MLQIIVRYFANSRPSKINSAITVEINGQQLRSLYDVAIFHIKTIGTHEEGLVDRDDGMKDYIDIDPQSTAGM
jgi:hypothetical protein